MDEYLRNAIVDSMSFDPNNIYESREFKSDRDLKFFFVSSGQQDLIKAIQYAYVEEYEGHEVFNLGFGDYDINNDTVDDASTTNNTDSRKVFNTVLITIPAFFEYNPEKMLIVQGSDSRPGFKEKCNETCKKKCGENCRKFNQRIRIYRSFVELHFDELNADYQFFGGFKDENENSIKEEYIKGKDYTSVLLIKRNK
ncbi:MAG: hypothetical protein ABIR30_01135 [Chitinophagaceae bacterium]